MALWQSRWFEKQKGRKGRNLMVKLRENLSTMLATFGIAFVLSVIANRVGYGYSFIESLPGLLILTVVSLVGYALSYLIPIRSMSSVLWISIIAILIASPISPFADSVLHYVGQVNLMAVVTPILGYSGVLIAKDWDAFKEIGLKGIVVSIFVVAGTFLVSSLLGDLFMALF